MRGYIRRRGRGYRVEIHIGYDANGKRLRHMKTLSNKKAAEKYLRQKLDELETEGAVRSKKFESLEDLLLRWLESTAKHRVRQSTFEAYEWVVRRYYLDSTLGKMAVSTITPADIQQRYSEILSKGTGAQGVRKAHTVLRQAFQLAVKMREISINPALSVELPKVKRVREMRIIEASEIRKFVNSALQEERLSALWVLAISTGMRPEEYLGLTWSDLSPDSRSLTIQRVLVRPRKVVSGQPNWRFESPKTEKSRRTLALEPQMAELLKQHRKEQDAEKAIAASAYEDNELVFATAIGTPIHITNLRNRGLRRVIARAGLDENITLYSLRHSAATALLKDRESIRIVADMLGHSTTRLTADLYSHVTYDMLEEASATLGKRVFGSDEEATAD